MKNALMCIVSLAACACSSLPAGDGGVVALQVQHPDSLFLHHANTLHARALNLQGDSVAASIYWRTQDTLKIQLDSVTGIVTGIDTGTVSVQARVGTLLSDILQFRVVLDTVATLRHGTP